MTWTLYVNGPFFLLMLGYSIFMPGICLAIGLHLGKGSQQFREESDVNHTA